MGRRETIRDHGDWRDGVGTPEAALPALRARVYSSLSAEPHVSGHLDYADIMITGSN